MAVGLRSASPLWFAATRLAGATVTVFAVTAASGALVTPPRRDVPLILSTALFRLATVMTLVFVALTLVPAGRASVLVWTSALWTVPIAAVFLGDRMTPYRWTGLLIGLAGVIVISELWNNNLNDADVVVGTGLLLLGAVCNASTSVHIRHHRWSMDPLQALPWQFLVAVIPVLLLAVAVEGQPEITWTWPLALNVIYQSVVVSSIAFWAQMIVLRRLSPVTVNLTMMGVPVIGVLSSALVLGEPMGIPLLIGMAMVLTGVGINLAWDRTQHRRPA